MKIAHLILAHKNPTQLERLINALQHPAFDFYIHVDKKSPIAPFDVLTKIKNVHFIKKRTKIYWAGYGTIQATINGFEEIPRSKYDYINVISAQDFPLKSPHYIYQFLLQNRGIEFITCESIENEWKAAAGRIKKYHLINWQIPGKHRLEKLLNKVLPPRKFPLDHEIVGRANWFTITDAATRYILDFLKEHKKIIRYYKYCWGADEFIFSTIIYNSPFRNKIQRNLVYVDWTGQTKGHPRILNTEDFPLLKASDKLFGRKFDFEENPDILIKLEELIKETGCIERTI